MDLKGAGVKEGRCACAGQCITLGGSDHSRQDGPNAEDSGDRLDLRWRCPLAPF